MAPKLSLHEDFIPCILLQIPLLNLPLEDEFQCTQEHDDGMQN